MQKDFRAIVVSIAFGLFALPNMVGATLGTSEFESDPLILVEYILGVSIILTGVTLIVLGITHIVRKLRSPKLAPQLSSPINVKQSKKHDTLQEIIIWCACFEVALIIALIIIAKIQNVKYA